MVIFEHELCVNAGKLGSFLFVVERYEIEESSKAPGQEKQGLNQGQDFPRATRKISYRDPRQCYQTHRCCTMVI